ncbi:hypothetical protein Adt_12278 [Abeliophyllum distichum]|uniref:Uncharacterized protein n=1 Tax=Abeliophyllum distichum TaxID=126358 RepID=A0ABD1UQB9_9LAMI
MIYFFTKLDKFVDLRETQQTQGASSGALLDEHAIVNEVLGERRGHIKGLDEFRRAPLPPYIRPLHRRAPQVTFHQFFGDPQNDDPQFAMYEAQLHRMQQKIELLKNSISVIVPEENDNEDVDKGLEDV